jgi:integrase
MSQQFDKVEGQPNLFLDRTSGIFYVRAMIRGRVKWRSTRKTVLRAAITEARQILGALEEGRDDTKRVPTLAEFWVAYRDAKAGELAPRSIEKITRLMEAHVLPQFGNFPLDEIDPLALQRFLNGRRTFGKVSASTANNEGALLHALFAVAVTSDKIAKSPMRWFKQAPGVTRQRVLTADEQDKLEALATPAQVRWLRFRLVTGIRCEEVEGIVTDRDIDWVGLKLTVTGKGYRGKKKTRFVPIIPAHVEEIRTLVAEQVAYAEGSRRPTKHGAERLFPQTGKALREQLERLSKAAGVEGVSPHVLRHTFATRYLAGGGDIYILSRILGHSSVGVTEKVYAHLLTEDLQARSAGIRVI